MKVKPGDEVCEGKKPMGEIKTKKSTYITKFNAYVAK
jgi:hypothetical protein